jgi:hypothetical protein
MGRTKFEQGLIKLSDSTYLIGADTLHMNTAGGAENSGNISSADANMINKLKGYLP